MVLPQQEGQRRQLALTRSEAQAQQRDDEAAAAAAVGGGVRRRNEQLRLQDVSLLLMWSPSMQVDAETMGVEPLVEPLDTFFVVCGYFMLSRALCVLLFCFVLHGLFLLYVWLGFTFFM